MTIELNKMELNRCNEDIIREFFSKYNDVKIEVVQQICILYCEGLINEKALLEMFGVETIIKLLAKGENISTVKSADLPRKITLDEVAIMLFKGNVICCDFKSKKYYYIDISKKPSRSIEESKTEVSIRGPRESFVEDITQNIALIRKRLKTSHLCYKKFTVGSETKTEVGILYIDNIINKEILNEAISRINKINIESLNSVTELEELISDKSTAIVPLVSDTSRPDFVVDSLLKGRFAILVENTSFAIIAPANLVFMLKSSEDLHYPYYLVSVSRFFRLFGLLFAVVLPGFWLALISYHQDQIPFPLLATVTIARMGLPQPAPLETIFVFFLLELFREAGARLPSTVGQTLTVVGGLIVGDAAIRAGFVSPSVIVIVALSTLASYTIVNQSLQGIVTNLRMFVLLFSAGLGMFGFYLAFFCIVIYLSSLQSFGIPYLAFFSKNSLTAKEALKSFLKAPIKYSKTRPKFLLTQKPRREPNE